jgi:hypothetical protein
MLLPVLTLFSLYQPTGLCFLFCPPLPRPPPPPSVPERVNAAPHLTDTRANCVRVCLVGWELASASCASWEKIETTAHIPNIPDRVQQREVTHRHIEFDGGQGVWLVDRQPVAQRRGEVGSPHADSLQATVRAVCGAIGSKHALTMVNHAAADVHGGVYSQSATSPRTDATFVGDGRSIIPCPLNGSPFRCVQSHLACVCIVCAVTHCIRVPVLFALSHLACVCRYCLRHSFVEIRAPSYVDQEQPLVPLSEFQVFVLTCDL